MVFGKGEMSLKSKENSMADTCRKEKVENNEGITKDVHEKIFKVSRKLQVKKKVLLVHPKECNSCSF